MALAKAKQGPLVYTGPHLQSKIIGVMGASVGARFGQVYNRVILRSLFRHRTADLIGLLLASALCALLPMGTPAGLDARSHAHGTPQPAPLAPSPSTTPPTRPCFPPTLRRPPSSGAMQTPLPLPGASTSPLPSTRPASSSSPTANACASAKLTSAAPKPVPCRPP